MPQATVAPSSGVARRHRISVDSLAAPELTALRNAVRKMQGIRDKRGFAGPRGHPWMADNTAASTAQKPRRRVSSRRGTCLPVRIGLSLQEQDAEACVLPSWAWPTARQSGIPAA